MHDVSKSAGPEGLTSRALRLRDETQLLVDENQRLRGIASGLRQNLQTINTARTDGE